MEHLFERGTTTYKFPVEHRENERHSNVAVLCPGQDVWELGMFDELMQDPASAEVIQRGDEFLQRHFHYKITEIYAADGDPNIARQTRYVQPGVCLKTIALHNKYKYQKKEGFATLPQYLTGNSMGEPVATIIAGATGFDTEYGGLWMLGKRGEVMQDFGDPIETVMFPVITNKGVIEELLQRHPDIDLCLINDKSVLIIGGPNDPMESAKKDLESMKVKVRPPLKADRAMHGRYVRPAADEFRKVLREVNFRTPMIPLLGTHTGRPIRDIAGIIDELDYGFDHTFDNTIALDFFDNAKIHVISELNRNGTFTSVLERTYEAVAAHKLEATVLVALGLGVAGYEARDELREVLTKHHPLRGKLLDLMKKIK